VSENAPNDPYGETERTINGYHDAVKQLNEVLSHAPSDWKAFQSSEVETLPNDIDPSHLRQAINDVFLRNEVKIKNPSRLAKCKNIMEAIYTKLSPLVKNLLVIVRDSSAVSMCCTHRFDVV
jgi:hypothetical protein